MADEKTVLLQAVINTEWAVGKMRKCVMRNAESKMRNEKCGKLVRNGG